MIDLRFGRYALGVCVAVLAACGGQASNGVVPATAVPNTFPYHKTFNYTGEAQDFKVPAGVRQLRVIVLGAHGAVGSSDDDHVALGGRVSALIPVTPGERLAVYVGGNASGQNGGFNGGADGGAARYGTYGYGGGGASDVREYPGSLSTRVVVAGGGGGAGGAVWFGYPAADGGKGGGLIGGAGGSNSYYGEGSDGGGGGTQNAGGSGGSGGRGSYYYGGAGSAGSLGLGGDGGGKRSSRYGGYYAGAGGGGGGGGYYGGGGGGAGGSGATSSGYFEKGGGGGGGSSYAEQKATDVHFWRGWEKSAHNGLVVFSWQ